MMMPKDVIWYFVSLGRIPNAKSKPSQKGVRTTSFCNDKCDLLHSVMGCRENTFLVLEGVKKINPPSKQQWHFAGLWSRSQSRCRLEESHPTGHQASASSRRPP